MVHGHHLRDHRDVLSGIERNRDLGNLDPEHVDLGRLESGPRIGTVFVPELESDHHFDTLLLPGGVDPKERTDVDNAEAPNLHVVGLELMSLAEKDVRPPPRDDDVVIRDEPVPTLNQVQHTLALADSTVSDKEQSNAVYVG